MRLLVLLLRPCRQHPSIGCRAALCFSTTPAALLLELMVLLLLLLLVAGR